MSALFYEAAFGFQEVARLATYPVIVAGFIDPLGPSTRVDLVDGVPDDWELGIAFLPGMDEVRVSTARLDLRGLRVSVPAEGWSVVGRDQGFLITLAQPARLVAITFDTPVSPDPTKALRVLLSPADPPGPPAFIHPPFALGNAFAAIPSHISQWTSGTSTVVDIDPTFGTSWLLQWGIGDDATNLNVVGVTTTVRSVTIERAVADVRLELRPDESGGDPVLVWNHPGVLDPAAGLQPAEMSPIARKRLGDRLAAANAADPPPPTLTLPLRLTAVTGGPVGVSGTELVVDYAASAVADGATLTMRGDPQPLGLSVPAGLRPDRGTWSINARHLGRELNGPIGLPAALGGPGVVVSVGHSVAAALPVVATSGGADVVLAAVTVDIGADGPAELVVEVRADVHGLPGAVLGSAVTQLDSGPRAGRELLLDPQPAVAAGAVVWIVARTTTGAVRWYADPVERRPALPAVAGPALRVSVDSGATWAPDESRLSGVTVPRARLLHRVDRPYGPPELTFRSGDVVVASVTLAPAGGAGDEFAVASAPVPGAVADLAGRTVGAGRTTVELDVATLAALDVRVTSVDLVYPPTARPTPT